MNRQEILIKTDDEWSGNYDDNFVKLIYNGLIPPFTPKGKKEREPLWRVSCWGNDDFGIDKDFESEQESIDVFNDLKSRDKINQQDLYDMGFTNF